MSLKEKAIQGVIWSAIQNWGSQLGSLAVFFLLARLLTPDDFGLVAIANIVVAFFQVFLQRGFTEVLIQRQSLEPDRVQTVFWMNLAIALVLTGLTFATTNSVADWFDRPELISLLPAFSILFPLAAFSQVQQALLERQLAFKAIAMRQLMGTFIGGTVGVAMALLDYGVWSLVVQQLLQELVGAIVLWGSSDWRPQLQFSRSHGRELFGFGIHLLGFNFLNFLNTRADDLLIGYFLGSTALGYYSVAYRILLVMQQLLVQTSKQVALPTFSRLQDDLERFRQAFYRATQLTSAIAFPAFLSVVVLAPEFIEIVFGQQWLPSIPVLQVLAVAGIFQSVSFFKSAVFIAMGKPAWSLWLSALTVVLNLIGFAIAVRWGIVAVAAAFVIRGYLVFPVGQWAVSRLIHTPILTYLQQFVAPLLSSLVMTSAMFVSKLAISNFVDSSLFLAFICSAIGVIIYAASIRIFAPNLFRELLAIARLANRLTTEIAATQTKSDNADFKKNK
ncbi:MAG: MOP flippase family protein [Cyanosarcina radialis HA8281-LM2]|jgi:PST family polysaccharide transporter|nr:MOP flippase family protein [Cyanosarcina radialis HA8281-LM2]